MYVCYTDKIDKVFKCSLLLKSRPEVLLAFVRHWHRQTEKLMWHAFSKQDGEVVVAGFFGAKAKDICCSGWEVSRDRMV